MMIRSHNLINRHTTSYISKQYPRTFLGTITQTAEPIGHVSSFFSSTSKNSGDDKEDASQGPTRFGYSSFGNVEEMSRVSSFPSAAWQPERNVDIQRVTQTAMIHELTQQQTRTIEKVVPWFLEVMPSAYFRQIPESFRMDHIKAISSVKDANMDLYLNLQSRLPDNRQVLTFVRPGTQPGLLLQMVQDLPWNQNTEKYLPLSRVQIFSAKDDSMSLNMFVYGEEESEPFDVATVGKNILDYAELVQANEYVGDESHAGPCELFEREKLVEYLGQCTETYILRSDPRRFLKQRVLFEMVSGTEGSEMSVEKALVNDQVWIDVAVSNSLPQIALEHTAHLLFLHNFDVTRAHLDVVSDGPNNKISLLRMLVKPVDNSVATVPSDETIATLRRDLKRSKWLDHSTMDLVFERYPELGITKGEIITAFCSLLHPIMSPKNALAYSKANIYDTVTNARYIAHAAAIADLFLDKFNPEGPGVDEEWKRRCDELRAVIEQDVEDSVASELLDKMLDVLNATYRTNIYMDNRYALSLRLDPNIMIADPDTSDKRDVPYGVFFVHGRRFNAYHVRFRDISRGGMRLVTPSSPEQQALESSHHYDECYGLAHAQQMKNKDIPEGGSKAVVLIDVQGLSNEVVGKDFVMRKSVKAFTDSILDLVVDTDETRQYVRDYWGKREVLYLGPDEQVIPGDIDWIIERARKRGYDTPAAFMSSKPRAGINHKEYGVTSEGVNVYLDVALRHTLGIDPTQTPFTVKMTGGPDGDVAGNEIKILLREYGPNAKIVGIADHSGCAEDADGLNQEELLRLVEKGLSISNFDSSKLGAEGVLHLVTSESGIKARNTMHNRLRADAFLPCGGRPNTIDIQNYRNFLLEDGKTPSSPLIVEGANLFITAEARRALYEDAGVAIVKDSSANKGGVITSSYEICAAMLLEEEEFFENKGAIVGEVLDKLRGLAEMEAKLLFREFENYPSSLPEVSKVISDTINVATDALSVALDTLSDDDKDALMPLFREHLPKTLADLAFDRVKDRVPEQYIKNAIASSLASKMVYKEGTKFFESQPRDRLAKVALKYVEKEKEIAILKNVLRDANIPEEEKETIVNLLDRGGARTALGIF